MHDATEAFIGDMVRPLKYEIPQYRQIEENLWRVISLCYDLPFVLHPDIKKADDVALMTERRDLVTHTPHVWSVRAEPDENLIRPLLPSLSARWRSLFNFKRRSSLLPSQSLRTVWAEQLFLDRFNELTSALSRS